MKDETIKIHITWFDNSSGGLFGEEEELELHITSLRFGINSVYQNVQYYTNKKNEFELLHVARKRIGHTWTIPYFKEEGK